MSEVSTETGGPHFDDQEILQNLPKKGVMSPVHFAASILMRNTRTYFEEGARDELREHEENGGSLLLLMTHFRRWEPIVMAQIARKNRSLHPLQYNTGITARRDVFDIPVAGPVVVRNSGAVPVDRALENLDETPEEKEIRKEKNQETQAVGGRFLANGYHWLIYPEGGSREILYKDGEPVKKDGKVVKKPRKPDELLPLQMGFVYSLQHMTPEERARVKLMGIAVHYGDENASSLRATVVVPRLVTPLEGNYENKRHMELVRQQGEALLDHGVRDAVRLHNGELDYRKLRVAA